MALSPSQPHYSSKKFCCKHSLGYKKLVFSILKLVKLSKNRRKKSEYYKEYSLENYCFYRFLVPNGGESVKFSVAKRKSNRLRPSRSLHTLRVSIIGRDHSDSFSRISSILLKLSGNSHSKLILSPVLG